MLDLNCTLLAAITTKALEDASGHPRWVNAIRRAFEEIDSNPWIERNPNGHGLIIGSPSGACYSANGECSCPAFAFGRACWHRAASRIVRLCDEREAAAAQLADKVIEVVDQSRIAQRQIVCQQPDNLCELHSPCSEHAAQAAAYLEAEAIIEAQRTGLVTMPEGDTLDTAGMRIARKIAAARATAQLNELFA